MLKIKPICSIFLIQFITNFGLGQNLVPNPGFEDYFVCPHTINTNKVNTKIAPYWNSPSYGTPDLYNTCSKFQMGIQNVTGFTSPYSGDGFSGIIVWEGKVGYREYLQTELSEPLKANQLYIISFRHKLSSYSNYCADRIGFSLTDSAVFYKQDIALPLTPAIYSKIKSKALDPNTGEWELLEITCKPKGGERFLTIGNFHDNISTRVTQLSYTTTPEPMLEHAAYYYIDEVSVIPKTEKLDTASIAQNLPKKTFTLSDMYILDNVLFDHNSDTLLQDSFVELNLLIATLTEHPDWRIRIFGHTDNIGSIEYNQKLSERRASSVSQYLISKGIQRERIQHKGYGKSKPLTIETDDKKQNPNRRVEIQFYQ